MCVSSPKDLTSEQQKLCNYECWLGAPSPPVGGTRLLLVVLMLLWYNAGMRLHAELDMDKPSVSCELSFCEADTLLTLDLPSLDLPCALPCDRLLPVRLPAFHSSCDFALPSPAPVALRDLRELWMGYLWSKGFRALCSF